jgi:hypothetical protein
MVLVALAMVAIIAMAALSIDVVTLYLARMEAQRSADAGALTAARVISLSGMTGDPGHSAGTWSAVCGGSGSPATQAATAAATQNVIGSVTPVVQVNYSAGGSTSPDCSGLPLAFGVNPLVTVQVTRANLPTFFSRIWGNTGNTVNATAVAEAFNSSNSGNVGNTDTDTITPVEPRCVKPWMVPNLDPLHPSSCTGSPGCNPFVDQSDGRIINPGVSSINGGVIGETFWLSPDCHHIGSTCGMRTTTTTNIANYPYFSSPPYVQGLPNLLYLPGQVLTAPVAVPSCSSAGSVYRQAIAGCDQSTAYQCGVQNQNTIDLSENPGPHTDDTRDGVECLIDEDDPTASQPTGQDTLNTSQFPFQILAGSSNALVGNGLSQGAPLTSSNSIVSLPIFDYSNPINGSSPIPVTIVGFLQVFINYVDQYGSLYVTVLNVTGCSNGTGQTVGPAVAGSSPVPVRLITPP